MSQYIGKTISLISNSNIRYIGTLHEINSEQSTVSLKQVRSFGTEGRRNGQNEIPPSENVYEFIVFRGSDVKDLKIAEEPVARPPPPPPFADVAIMSTGPHAPAYGFPGYGYAGQAFSYQQPPPIQHPQHNAAPVAPAAPGPAPAPTAPKQMQSQPPVSVSAVPQNVQPQVPSQPAVTTIVPALPVAATVGAPSATKLTEKLSDNKRDGAKTQEAPKQQPVQRAQPSVQQQQQQQQQQQKSQRPANVNNNTTNKTSQSKMGNDYDFQQNNAKFVKDESKESVIPAVEEVYNKKSSFFDNLSTIAGQKDQMTSFERRDEEHKLNMETFGQAQVHRRRGRGGARGRGGRGFRGRGGGGSYRGNSGRGGSQANQTS